MRRALGVFLLLTACATTPPAPRPISQAVVDDQTRATIESLRAAVAADPSDGMMYMYLYNSYLTLGKGADAPRSSLLNGRKRHNPGARTAVEAQQGLESVHGRAKGISDSVMDPKDTLSH